MGSSDKSKVAEAYAEVRADTSMLPKDLGKVPTIMSKMLSLGGIKGVSQLLQGNITGFAENILGAGYKAKAEVLKKASEAAKKAAEEDAKEAEAYKKAADQKQSAAEKLDKKQEDLIKKSTAAKERAEEKEAALRKRAAAATDKDKKDALLAEAEKTKARAASTKAEIDGKIATAKARAKQLRDEAKDHYKTASLHQRGADKGRALAAQRDEASQAAEQLAQRAGMLGGVAIKIALTAAIAAIKAVSMAAQQASENLKTAQIVRATGQAAGWSAEQLGHMQNELRKVTNYKMSDIAAAQQALLKHQNVQGLQFPKALQAAADLAAISGEKLESVAAEIGQALGEMGQGADGANKAIELLNKYGMTLSTAEQGQLRAASASRDHAKAQEFLLSKLEGFKGAAKEASETGAGGFDKLRASLDAAAGTIFGITGGIGGFAAKLATVIDRFMELSFVQDVLNTINQVWNDVTQSISAFIDDNEADFREWGSLLKEIGQNTIDHIMSLWQYFKDGVKVILDFIGGENGNTWSDIKQVVTDTLNFIAMLTTDFGLTVQLAWNQIKLGAVLVFDAIEHGFEAMIVTGMSAFQALKAGWNAIWDGKDVGQAMADSFKKAFDEGIDNIKDSDAVARLKAEADAIRRAMGVKRSEIQKERQKIDKAQDDKKKELEKPKDQRNYKNTAPFKFEFTGFEEMSKKIQISLFPSEQMALQKAAVAAAEKQVDIGGKQLGFLQRIAEGAKAGTFS